jgi:hypothetical protein
VHTTRFCNNLHQGPTIKLEGEEGGYGFFVVFVIYPNVEFWKKKKALCTPKKINILTLVLFEKKILNETKKP